LTKQQELLDSNGYPIEFGCAFTPIIHTNREKACQFRLKEWDFYQISDESYTLQVTYGHVSYAGAINVCLFGYNNERYEVTLPLIFPFGSLNLPPKADTPYHLFKHTKNFKLDITHSGEGERNITFRAKSTKHGDCSIDLKLTYPKTDEGILVVTPFKNKKHFYHNYKQNCWRAEGTIVMGGKTHTFTPPKAFGLIDWGRGVLPYIHSWWWGCGSTDMDGNRLGFNIGEFGDTHFATENTLFYNGKAHKLADIAYKKMGGYNDKMVFTSTDDRFEMVFTPIYDNYTNLNLLVAHNRCHQVFGYWSGTVILDDSTIIQVKDMFAFVEFAKNRW